MDFERILQMTTSERNLALLQDEAFVDDVTEFLAIRQLYNAAIKQWIPSRALPQSYPPY